MSRTVSALTRSLTLAAILVLGAAALPALAQPPVELYVTSWCPYCQKAASYFREGMTLPVEFFEGQPMGIVFPEVVEIRVRATAPPIHTPGGENVWKAATLDNGLSIMIPPFIASGELIRVDVEHGTYIERAKKK